ncbi:MAG: hypothetical protein LBM59_05735 [Ruminococcus sp.]|nr:hypothetical protein [Ruminococcus sp.]
MKQKIDTEIYSEKTIATYETKYRDNPLSKPQEIVLTITSGHLYGKAFVCEQVATKEEDIFYSKFSASIMDISNITINTYIKEYPIYISFEKPSKDNKYAKDRRRIILPSFENPENIVAQIIETKEKLKPGKKKKTNPAEERYVEDYTETAQPTKKSGIDDIIDIWDNVQPESEETVEVTAESEVIVEKITEEQIGSAEIESEVNFTEAEDGFIDEEEQQFRTPPIAPAPPEFLSETLFEAKEESVRAEEVLFETVRTAKRSEKPVYEAPQPETILYRGDEESDDVKYESEILIYETPETADDSTVAEDSEVTEDSGLAEAEEVTEVIEDTEADEVADVAEDSEVIEDSEISDEGEADEVVVDNEADEVADNSEVAEIEDESEVAEIEEASAVAEAIVTRKPSEAAKTREVLEAPKVTKSSEKPGAKLSSLESFEESMKKLKIMYESGVITLEEFNAEKKNILKTLY